MTGPHWRPGSTCCRATSALRCITGQSHCRRPLQSLVVGSAGPQAMSSLVSAAAARFPSLYNTPALMLGLRVCIHASPQPASNISSCYCSDEELRELQGTTLHAATRSSWRTLNDTIKCSRTVEYPDSKLLLLPPPVLPPALSAERGQANGRPEMRWLSAMSC